MRHLVGAVFVFQTILLSVASGLAAAVEAWPLVWVIMASSMLAGFMFSAAIAKETPQ